MDTENKKNETIEETTEIVEQVQQEEPVTGDVYDTEQEAIAAAEGGEHSGTAMAAGLLIVATVGAAAWCAKKLSEKHAAKKAAAVDGDTDAEETIYRKLSFGERMSAFFTGKVPVYLEYKENEG